MPPRTRHGWNGCVFGRQRFGHENLATRTRAASTGADLSKINITTLHGEGQFDAYLAEPAGAAKAAIIVIQEIFGVNAGIRRKCDQLAEAGYLALAPDLFWKIERGIELDPDVPEQLQQAFGLFKRFDQDAGVRDIEATIRAARARDGRGKVGAVGYCLGGRMAYLTAARTDVDARAVSLLAESPGIPAGVFF